MQQPPRDVTQMLIDWCEGDAQALEALMPVVYEELRRQAARYMRRERRNHTLQPTALVNETYLQLVDQNRVKWQSRAQFFGVAAELMRRVVLKHARRHKTEKRGGQARRVPLNDDMAAVDKNATELIALDDALERLAGFATRQSKILELRHFGGLTIEETAEVLGISVATVKREARLAQAWLKRELSDAEPVESTASAPAAADSAPS
ncbi:MAG: sigma-70 family RNA polymerase sigma factor [Acidobacteriota bacterium]